MSASAHKLYTTVATQKCTNHCSACGAHFHSTDAFDRHRQGDFASDDPKLARRCVHPLAKRDSRGRSPFVVLTTGTCDLYPDDVRHGQLIWTLSSGLESARRLREGKHTPGGVASALRERDMGLRVR